MRPFCWHHTSAVKTLDLELDSAVTSTEMIEYMTEKTGPDGAPLLVHLRREKYQDILVTPGTAVSGSMTASFAAGDVDLAEVAEQLRGAGADVSGPLDTPWFSTDVAFTDTDGNKMILTAPRTADQAQAQEWVGTNIAGDFEVPTGASFDTDRA